MKTPESFNINLDVPKPASILESLDNQLKLARILQPVYDNRPEIKSFVGAMADTRFAAEYAPEAISKNEEYVRQTRAKIDEENSSFGRENLDHIEIGFQLSEIMQAMIVDRMNKHWFKDFQAIMTSDYDDLHVGIDAVMKHKQGSYLGASFDFTVTNKDNKVYKKLENEWDRNVKKGNIQRVKYFEDPDTKKKGSLLVPKFVIGASKNDVEELAQAYLAGDQETLDNHPFKYLMLLQIEEQLQTALDYYETNPDKKLDFARTQYNRLQVLLRGMKNEIHLDEKMQDVDLHEYTKNNVALDMIRRFRIMKDRRPSSDQFKI